MKSLFFLLLFLFLTLAQDKTPGVKLTKEEIVETLKTLEHIEVPHCVRAVTYKGGEPHGVIISQDEVECFRNAYCKKGFFCDYDYTCKPVSEEKEDYISEVEERKNDIVTKKMLTEALKNQEKKE